MLPEDILLRFLLFFCSVGSLESCVRGGVRGSVLLIRICLMVECTCYLGTSRWLMTVCIVICFPVARVLLIPGGSSLMIVGGGGRYFIGITACCGICYDIWGCWANLRVGTNVIVSCFEVCVGIW